MSQLRIVVTGGSGKIGAALTSHLLERGHSVVTVDKRAPGNRITPFVWADLAQRAQFQATFDAADVVIHLGEIASMGRPGNEDHVYAENTRIGSTVMQASLDAGNKLLVYVSTCQVYDYFGWHAVAPRQAPCDESYPVSPQNTYALSKAANESFGRILCNTRRFNVTVIRLPWVIMDNWISRSPKSGKHSLEPFDDKRVHDGMGSYLHLSDACAGLGLAAEKCQPGFNCYHLVAPDIACRTPLPKLLAQNGFPVLPETWEPYRSAVLTTRAARELGWSAKWTLGEQFGDLREQQK